MSLLLLWLLGFAFGWIANNATWNRWATGHAHDLSKIADALNGRPKPCNGCGKPLDPTARRIADGCPCNSPRGVNHGLVKRETCPCVECDPAHTGAVRQKEWEPS